MTYTEALEYIMGRRKFQKSSSHERIEKLLSLLGDPHKKLRFVHVVGTNGKGSVSTALSCILSKSGYKTGLFTSPYIISFNERIKVDGEFIPDSEIAELTSLIKEKTDLMEKQELYPTVFEVTTALAMVYFKKVKCDVVVLEAGIGGKNDSTNVIESKLLSVIMSISADHTEMLGSTDTEIALEKCGIIPEDGAVVSYPFDGEAFGFTPQSKEAAEVIRKVCREKNAQLTVPDTSKLHIISQNIKGTALSYGSLEIKINLCGKHQIANMLTVAECALALRKKGLVISDESITEGIKDFFIPGRTEVIKERPLIILDGGHNEGCMLALKETVKVCLSDKKITLLCAFMKDKDYEKSLGHILPLCAQAVFTRTDYARGEESAELCRIAKKYCPEVYAHESVPEALSKALSLCGENVLIVCGSFYLVSDVRKLLQNP